MTDITPEEYKAQRDRDRANTYRQRVAELRAQVAKTRAATEPDTEENAT